MFSYCWILRILFVFWIEVLYLANIFVQSMAFLFIPVTTSSRSYIILSYTCRSIIHFMLIFVETVRSMSRTCFFLIWINAQVFFLLCITIAPVSKNSSQYLCEPITNTYLSCSINLFVYYFINVMLFWLLKLYSHLKDR